MISEALGLIRQAVPVEHPVSFVEELLRLAENLVHVLAVLCAGGHDGVEVMEGGVFGDGFGELFPVHEVDLVEHEYGRKLRLSDLFDQFLLDVPGGISGLGDEDHGVGGPDGRADGLHHVLPELGPRSVDAGRVEEDVLVLALRQNPGDPVPRGLGLGRNDGDLFP